MPKVSIVLPTYNGEKYIKEAIRGVISQTYNDWELIVVNDCSTDNTKKIVEEQMEKDKRICLINNKENKKLPQSLNVGFENAKGKYFTWTSDDNYYLPNAILEMVQFLDKNEDYPMVCTDMYRIDENGNHIRGKNEYDAVKMYFNNCVGASFLYRKEVANDIGGYEVKKFLIEDYDYWYRVLEYYGKIGYINKSLYQYREHQNSLSSTRQREIKIRLLEFRYEHLNTIIRKFYDREELLTPFFYEFYEGFSDMFTIKIMLKRYVKAINMDEKWDDKKKTIIYGAGQYGEKALSLLNKNVAFFSDKNKAGKSLKGIEIISVDSMINLKKEYNICIAVSSKLMYEVIKELENKGLVKFASSYWLKNFLLQNNNAGIENGNENE